LPENNWAFLKLDGDPGLISVIDQDHLGAANTPDGSNDKEIVIKLENKRSRGI